MLMDLDKQIRCASAVRHVTSDFCWCSLGLAITMALALNYAVLSVWGSASAAHSMVLLTYHEAAQLRLTEREWRQLSRARVLSTGPIVVVEKPQLLQLSIPTIEATTPIDFDVLFEPRTSAVDMDSLDIEARRGFFSKSLTSMLKPYVHGTELQVRKAEIPPGRYVLEVSIADQAGNTTTETYRLEISPP